jgi:hypothetical protein
MGVYVSDSFLVPVPEDTGIDYPHVADTGYSEFEHKNYDFADTWLLSGDPSSDSSYRTDLEVGALTFDLSDNVGNILTQKNYAILCNRPMTGTAYEAEMRIRMNPHTMVAEGVIALRGERFTGYDVAFAGVKYTITGGSITLEFLESDGDGISNSVLLGTVALSNTTQVIKIVAQISTLTVKGYVNGVQVGASQTTSGTNLGTTVAAGEVYFVIQPTSDTKGPPYTGKIGLGPYSQIKVTYLAVGSVGALGSSTTPHMEGFTLPWNYDDGFSADSPIPRPLIVGRLYGFGTDAAMAHAGTMPLDDPDAQDDEAIGGRMRPLIGHGYDKTYQDANHGPNFITANITLPHPLKVSMHRIGGLTMQFGVVLPKPQFSKFVVGWRVDVVLPKPTLAITLNIANNITFDIQLPALSAEATGHIGTMFQFGIVLPQLQVAGNKGWDFDLRLPALVETAVFVQNLSWSIAYRLPKLKTNIEFSAPVGGYRFAILLPALAMARSLTGALRLPALRLSMRLSPALLEGSTPERRAWVMNLVTGAVTEFSNFEFRAMGRAFNTYFGIGLDGNLFSFGGDDDDGNPISWAWESGITDFGVNGQKGLLALYVDGLFENDAVFTVVADRTRRTYGHKARGDPFNHEPHRVPLGKGVRTRNVGIGMADESGGYLELDKITPEYVVTPRNL